MENNSTNINKTNNHLSPQTTEHKWTRHTAVEMWVGTRTKMWRHQIRYWDPFSTLDNWISNNNACSQLTLTFWSSNQLTLTFWSSNQLTLNFWSSNQLTLTFWSSNQLTLNIHLPFYCILLVYVYVIYFCVSV
jgi:hypothetical protein